MEVYENDNNIVTDLPNVLNKWKSMFKSLYNLCSKPGNFDDEFYSECMSNLDTDNEYYFRELDNDITIDIKGFGQIDTVQNRVICFYLGVHKFAPNLAINVDFGWISSSVRRKSEMLHYYNRQIHIDSERLTTN